jgi:hypothetical protein
VARLANNAAQGEPKVAVGLGSKGAALDWRCDLHALPLIDKYMHTYFVAPTFLVTVQY